MTNDNGPLYWFVLGGAWSLSVFVAGAVVGCRCRSHKSPVALPGASALAGLLRRGGKAAPAPLRPDPRAM